jgi:TolB-like protein/Tfp pilus assembly protein PilF
MRAWRIQLGGQSAAKAQPGSPASKAPALALPDKPSIAVLPFQNMSGDPEQEYFTDGMVEDIITALSRFKSLFVIARNSTFTYKGKPVDVRQVGRELGVRYVLEGSVRRAGGRLRITGQLIDAASNHHVWADKFDGAFADVFELQDKIAEQVVSAIAPALEAAEIERARIARSDNLNAYDLYLRAKACWDQVTYSANQEGLCLVRRAIEAAPDYAIAHALGAELYVQRNSAAMPFDRDREVPEALRLARRAAELSRDHPEVLTSAAATIGNLLGDTAANAMLDRAIELNPNLARAWGLRGMGALFVSEPERAIEYAQRALRLSPLDPGRYVTLATMSLAFIQLERYDEAYQWAEKAYDARETTTTARPLIVSARLSGRRARSEEIVKKLLVEHPDMTIQRLLQGLSRWHGEKEKRQLQEALRLAGLPDDRTASQS